MIDKNDVKMPERGRDVDESEALKQEQIDKIKALLDMVNNTENKQQLRLGQDYYANFHWFGIQAGGKSQQASNRSYFSYQEEAVYDFIFNLNKSGILSDQVGMGKTIEAGMIISELASRHELRSLLIIVPNEIMASKWEYELKEKFGVKSDEGDGQRRFPHTIRNYDDFCRCIWDCIEASYVGGEQFWENFSHECKPEDGDTLNEVLSGYFDSDIEKAVDLLNEFFEDSDDRLFGQVNVGYDNVNKEFTLFKKGKTVGRKNYDFEGRKDRLNKMITIPNSNIYKNFENRKQYIDMKANLAKQKEMRLRLGDNRSVRLLDYQKALKAELDGLLTLIGDYGMKTPSILGEVATQMKIIYPILIVPIFYSEKANNNGGIVQRDFLNRSLYPIDSKSNDIIKGSYKLMYPIIYPGGDENGNYYEQKYEDFRIIDFFIESAYQTLIVDEVHDYINVKGKVNKDVFHQESNRYKLFSSEQFNRYELFDDYYFIEKSTLYKKLKELADMAERKIFLTATPIKSDMVDFYLLTLIASNKDSENYKKIMRQLDELARTKAKTDIDELYSYFLQYILTQKAENDFNDYSGDFLAEKFNDEENQSGETRYIYPYFNNAFLRANVHDKGKITDYLLGQVNYMTVSELIMELIVAYNAEMQTDNEDKQSSENNVGKTVLELKERFMTYMSYDGLPDEMRKLVARIAYRALLNNTVRMRFEEDFTYTSGNKTEHIKRIRKLLEMEDGPRRWNRTYRKYGIRHTRHQTYKLDKSGCQAVGKLNDNKQDRYDNLPVWPRRNGKVLYLFRDDVFFDSYLNIRRQSEVKTDLNIKLEQLPNMDRFEGTAQERAEQEKKFEAAEIIFDYINDSMTGELIPSYYCAEDMDDKDMVEYKLALVTKLMRGSDKSDLGEMHNKVLLFAENDREKILEWFLYLGCIEGKEGKDEKKAGEYAASWKKYFRTEEDIGKLNRDWKVSDDTADLGKYGNRLIVIDPTKYEKGVDLQKADTIINFDISYDPLKMEQRIGRIDRIRPGDKDRNINIISFVPFNNMSGFIIYFFADELKLFTQWMGETTGIVSVNEDENASVGDHVTGEEVSFEQKVLSLEKYYNYLYCLCKGDATAKDAEQMANDFADFFPELFSEGKGTKGNVNSRSQVRYDFKFIQEVQKSFDTAFRNSITPKQEGVAVDGSSKKVVRFNSKLGIRLNCSATDCAKCPNKNSCNNGDGRKWNDYAAFKNAVDEFFNVGEAFYKRERENYNKELKDLTLSGGDESGQKVLDYLERRRKAFEKAKAVVNKLPEHDDSAFVMDFGSYRELFGSLKRLLWDDIVAVYLDVILKRFYDQCDTVLEGANLFARFIKAFSIAEFMNNMDSSEDDNNNTEGNIG